ncbi:MAG: thioesterase [Terrimonas sp.]|nr:thioesterase [Terrimonas sp.]
MEDFVLPLQIRWSDLDPNFHLRHAVYYDWGSMCRMEFLVNHGLTTALMSAGHFGPILFREECVFRKEIRYGDLISINLEIMKSTRDYSRWSIKHTIQKAEKKAAAYLTIEGAWMQTVERKLIPAPPIAVAVFSQMPKAPDFSWMD